MNEYLCVRACVYNNVYDRRLCVVNERNIYTVQEYQNDYALRTHTHTHKQLTVTIREMN